MEIRINSEIGLLQETADLLCAYVNGVSPTALTAEGPFCIPASVLRQIMDHVFHDLDRTQWQAECYFRGYSTAFCGEPYETMTCVGCMLIATTVKRNCTDLDLTRALMQNHIAANPGFYEIVNHTAFALGTRTSSTYRPLYQEIGKLDLPDELRLQLLEVLSNFHCHVDCLCDFLKPFAIRLLPLLLPWWESAKPRFEKWEQITATEAGRQNLLKSVNQDAGSLGSIWLNFHFINAGIHRAVLDVENSELYCAIGMGKEPDTEKPKEMLPPEASALRLLSSMDRVEMLRAMSGRVMAAKEITQELGMNPGSVFRDLNSLFYSKLIDLVMDGNHRKYTTNLENFELLLRQLYGYVKHDGQQ